MNDTLPVIVIGAGGHAKVLVGLLDALGAEVLGLTDGDPSRHGEAVLGRPVIGGDDAVDGYAPSDVALVLGVGSTGPGPARREIYARFCGRGYRFRSCIHPAAWVAPDAVVGSGTQIMAGAVVQPGCRIGDNVIVNTGAGVDHDCRIGDHVHIAPGAVLGGAVALGAGAHIGSGATVIEQRRIGAGAMVCAGACVVTDVAEGARVGGVPAAEI